jgi:hypothetical protein
MLMVMESITRSSFRNLSLHGDCWPRRHPARMSQLPGVANAYLDDAKITIYLLKLNTSHPTGAREQGKVLYVVRFLLRKLGGTQKNVAGSSA